MHQLEMETSIEKLKGRLKLCKVYVGHEHAVATPVSLQSRVWTRPRP